MDFVRATLCPFVLLGRVKVPSDGPRSDDQVYDPQLQLWLSRATGEPIVLQKPLRGSEFGETTVTATREGLDQSEITDLSLSDFGETPMTKTSEGQDESEISAHVPSEFGETIITRSHEGCDQTEVSEELIERW